MIRLRNKTERSRLRLTCLPLGNLLQNVELKIVLLNSPGSLLSAICFLCPTLGRNIGFLKTRNRGDYHGNMQKVFENYFTGRCGSCCLFGVLFWG